MLIKYLGVMKEAALRCGELILDRSAVHTTSKTSSRDVVTQYDVAVQSALVDDLHRAFPEAEFVAEEEPAHDAAAGKVVFVIDPIDGTMNFVKNFHHSCISIGCLMDGQPAAAVVYDPYKKELFHAGRGMGAYLNGEPIHVTEDDLADTLVLFGTSPYNPAATEQTFRMAHRMYNKSLDVRRMGSAALDLCYTACGRAGLYFEMQLSLWDYAAGALILTEAGGVAMKLDGSPLGYAVKKSSILVGSPKTVSQSGLLDEENV